MIRVLKKIEDKKEEEKIGRLNNTFSLKLNISFSNSK